jgi:hypothetical protein
MLTLDDRARSSIASRSTVPRTRTLDPEPAEIFTRPDHTDTLSVPPLSSDTVVSTRCGESKF